MEVTIIIPTFYGGQILQNCVNSILQHVSNAQIYIIKNDIGWLKACNKGIENTKNDVILLNDDTIVLTDLVKEMQAVAYSDEGQQAIGIVGGVALATDQSTIINYGIYVAPDGNTAHRYFGQPKGSVEIEKQQAVEGSLFYIKRELIKRMGVLDEKYGMGYRAEVAYCFKARQNNWRVMSCPTAEYVHLVSQTAGRLGIQNDTHEIFMAEWGNLLALGKV